MNKKFYKALILAAGSGTRISNKFNIPKCLLEINNKKILDYQLEAFKYAGIKDIYIVTGYKSFQIKKHLKKYKKLFKINFIQNKIFNNTNNMYSASLAGKFLQGEKLIICNADVVIDKQVVKQLISGKNNNEIAVDLKVYDKESMKVRLGKFKKILEINKKIPKKISFACSIDFYKLSESASINFFKVINKHIKDFGKNDWTEVAIQKVFKNNSFFPNNIGKLKWHEIDNYSDLVQAKNKFSDLKAHIFKKYRNFIVDIDGTTFKKNIPLEGTQTFLKNLFYLKKNITFLSNNSSMSFKNFQNLFKKVKFNLKKKNMVISSDVLINYLKTNNVKRVYALANKKFVKTLKSYNIKIDINYPEFVIITYDDEVNYKKLQKASELINKNIKILSTHDDNFYPSEKGPIPDAGSLLSLLETTTGKKPYKVFGKPSKEIKKLLNFKGSTLVIGDRLNKDIKFAKNCKYDSALVLSGADSLTDVKKKTVIKPNFILSSIKDLN